MQYYTLVTPACAKCATEDAAVPDAAVLYGKPFYPRWVCGDGFVRTDVLDGGEINTADVHESMVWSERDEARKAADVLNRESNTAWAVVKTEA